MSTAEKMRIERKGAVGTIVLDNPERMNIVDTSSLRRLAALLTEIERDGSVRVVIIAGMRHFCAGADVRGARCCGRVEPGTGDAWPGRGWPAAAEQRSATAPAKAHSDCIAPANGPVTRPSRER